VDKWHQKYQNIAQKMKISYNYHSLLGGHPHRANKRPSKPALKSGLFLFLGVQKSPYEGAIRFNAPAGGWSPYLAW